MARRKQKVHRTRGELSELVAKVDSYIGSHPGAGAAGAISVLGLPMDLKAYQQFKYRQKKVNGGEIPLDAIPDRHPVPYRRPQYKKREDSPRKVALDLLRMAIKLLEE
jgi:hypothetical protein